MSWQIARSSLKGYDRDSLLKLVGEMYRLSPANRNFLQARLLSDPEDRAKPFKKRLRAALNPDAVGKDDHDLAAAKRTMREFSQASSDPEGIADLKIYAVECGNKLTLTCGEIDEVVYFGLMIFTRLRSKKSCNFQRMPGAPIVGGWKKSWNHRMASGGVSMTTSATFSAGHFPKNNLPAPSIERFISK